MTRRFSILKFTEDKGSNVLHETHSQSEARQKFAAERLDVGEQVLLRSHLNGETKIVGMRDNGYCS